MAKKFIKFKLLTKTEKTNVYSIYSVYGVYYIGKIKWYPNWEQYCFYPNPMTIWNTKCLAEIQEFIKELMEKMKKK